MLQVPCPPPSASPPGLQLPSELLTPAFLCLSATDPLILHLSAYTVNCKSTYIPRYKDGERLRTMVLNPPNTFNRKDNVILPGPACLKYLQDAKHKSSGYGWPTTRLAACMSKSDSIPSVHWLMDSEGRKVTCTVSNFFFFFLLTEPAGSYINLKPLFFLQ